MPTSLRRAVYAILALLWLSGCAWLVAHFVFPTQTSFGPAPNPLEPVFMRIHGWLAVGTVFLFGWITSEHISDRWRKSRNRVSGLSLAGFAAVLAISGYALYYTTDRLHDDAGVVHEALGAVALFLALVHWRGRERSASNRARVQSI